MRIFEEDYSRIFISYLRIIKLFFSREEGCVPDHAELLGVVAGMVTVGEGACQQPAIKMILKVDIIEELIGGAEDELPGRKDSLLVVSQTMRKMFGSSDGVEQLLVGQG